MIKNIVDETRISEVLNNLSKIFEEELTKHANKEPRELSLWSIDFIADAAYTISAIQNKLIDLHF